MKYEMLRGWLRHVVLMLAVSLPVVLTGCVGYRLGGTLPPNVKSVFVPICINNTGEPMAETEVTRALKQELQKDGSLDITSESEADTILEVTLTSIKFEPLSYEQASRKTANNYRLYLKADVLFKRSKTSQVLAKRSVTGETTFIPAGDIASAKRLALPKGATDLAHRIVEAVVEYW